MVTEDSVKIAEVNDAFRRSCTGVMMTPEVLCLTAVPRLMEQIVKFDKFTEDNDPYGEHDFGMMNWYGEKVLWKIDYYDQALSYGEDPLSPDCRRVMTIMLASEY
jgi:hypothetical protein